jgi:hypothetical protein
MMCGMARLTGDWQRVARFVADRRAELDLTQEQVNELGGPSPATQSLVENGMRASIQATTAGGYERALQWGPGSIRSLLSGGNPIIRQAGRSPGRPEDDGLDAMLARILAVPRRRAQLKELIVAARLDPELGEKPESDIA